MSAMHIRIDPDLCEGNAVCVDACPEVFAVGDDDLARLLVETPATDLHDAVRDAVRRCPRQALSLTQETA